MIKIVFPPGAHGNFLCYLLNRMSGKEFIDHDSFHGVAGTYDRQLVRDNTLHTFYGEENDLFTAIHGGRDYHGDVPGGIDIVVEDDKDHLKYLSVCISRAASMGIFLDELHINTMAKLREHPMMLYFLDTLESLNHQGDMDIPNGIVREWLRVCFFNDGNSINGMIDPYRMTDSYKVSFDTFYDKDKLIKTCHNIYDHYGFDVIDDSFFDHEHEIFMNRNRCYHVDDDCGRIKDAMRSKDRYEFQHMTVVKEAWLDAWLQKEYGIDPLLRDDYPTDTDQLRKEYGL